MTSKQRASLRKMANAMDPVVYIGKGGLTDTITEETGLVLEKRELIKIQVQPACAEEPKAVADELARRLSADVIAVLGKRAVLYRKAQTNSRNLI